MNVIDTIQKANYEADDAAIETLARQYHESLQAQGTTRGVYLRVLLAATQKAVSGHVTLRARRKAADIPDDVRATHLTAFEACNTRLYSAVLRGVVSSEVEDREGLRAEERRKRALERNRRTNFARSAAATLRAFIRGGGDVTALAVPTATKMGIAAATDTPSRPRVSGAELARRRIQRAAERLSALVESLAGSDKAQAVEALRRAMAPVNELLMRYAGKPVTRPDQAVAEHRLLKTSAGTFWPTNAMEHRTQ
jgi:hypothetical protein